MGMEFWFGAMVATAFWLGALVFGFVAIGVRQMRRQQAAAESIARGVTLARAARRSETETDALQH